jgi:hypothetical protein
VNKADLKKLESNMDLAYIHPVLYEAAALLNKKSLDYNGKVDADPARKEYFPYGEVSYMQMLHTKWQRLNAVTGRHPNFESARDTLLDLINYCAFFAAYLDEQEKNDE